MPERPSKKQRDQLTQRLQDLRGFDPAIKQLLVKVFPGYRVSLRNNVNHVEEFMSIDELVQALRHYYGFSELVLIEVEQRLRAMRHMAIDLPTQIFKEVDMAKVIDPNLIIDRFIAKHNLDGPSDVNHVVEGLKVANRIQNQVIRDSKDIIR